jgi:hypothetical protein
MATEAPLIGWDNVDLDINDGTASAFVAVDDLNWITPPDFEYGIAESKRLNLTAATIVKIATLKKGQAFTFNYDFSQIKKARIDAHLGVEKQFKITIDDAVDYTKTVPGIVVSNLIDQVEPDQIMTCTCTVEISGAAV